MNQSHDKHEFLNVVGSMATDASTIPLYCKYIHSAKQAHMMPPLKQLNIKTHLRIYRRVGLPARTLTIQSPL